MGEKFSWEESSVGRKVQLGGKFSRHRDSKSTAGRRPHWRDAFCDIVPNRFREGRDGGSPVLLRASNLGFRVSIFEGWVTSRTAISRAASNSVGRLRLSGVVVIFCDVFLSPDASVRAERGGSSLLGVWRESHEASGAGLIQDLAATLFGPKARTRGCGVLLARWFVRACCKPRLTIKRVNRIFHAFLRVSAVQILAL